MRQTMATCCLDRQQADSGSGKPRINTESTRLGTCCFDRQPARSCRALPNRRHGAAEIKPGCGCAACGPAGSCRTSVVAETPFPRSENHQRGDCRPESTPGVQASSSPQCCSVLIGGVSPSLTGRLSIQAAHMTTGARGRFRQWKATDQHRINTVGDGRLG